MFVTRVEFIIENFAQRVIENARRLIERNAMFDAIRPSLLFVPFKPIGHESRCFRRLSFESVLVSGLSSCSGFEQFVDQKR